MGGWVAQNSTDIKAISAPSWGLAGWLGLSLAIRVFSDFDLCEEYQVKM